MTLKTPSLRGWTFAVIAAVIVLGAPYVLPMGEAHHGWWDSIPAWWALFGGLGCALIVLVAKTLGHLLLQKPEDWYE